jgi:UDP-N-acetylmuramyl tripeptide synthase
LVAERIQPDVVRILASRIDAGTVVVSGTNGKTTTSKMLAAIFHAAGLGMVRNASGSNLTRGVATALVEAYSNVQRQNAAERVCGLFEVDEAALPEVASLVRPSRLLLNNLFRDQLDRYGEVATVARVWARALTSLPPSSVVVANADDPLVSDVASASGVHALYFGLESIDVHTAEVEHSSDVKSCPRCGGVIAYSLHTLGHLGHYRCTACDFMRPEATVWADGVDLLGIDGSRFTLHRGTESISVQLPLPGLYNVYNAVAAAATALSLDLPLEVIADSLRSVTPAFGRMERVAVGNRTVYLALAKNPAGLNEVLRTVLQTDGPAHLLMGLNDNTADGHDVSWIWDADVEMLAGNVRYVGFSGTRGADMALRFKYAEVQGTLQGSGFVEAKLAVALQNALDGAPGDGVLFIIPTYTAMLEVRAALVDLGYLQPYWEG